MAQDFFQAFWYDTIGTIGSDITLCGSDVVGINIVPIQALEGCTSELWAENEQIKCERLSLKLEMAKFESLLQ